MARLAGRVVAAAVLLAVLSTALLRIPNRAAPQAARPSVDFGFTFSERQADYLKLPWREAFQAAMDLDPNLVRLGAYWDDIEPRPGAFDFSTLDWLLDNMPPQSSVLLTVGMKAPRWPEYYLPAWLPRDRLSNGADVASDPAVRQATLDYIRAVVEHEKDRPNIRYWQVENEPLDPSGPRHWRIGAGFLEQEIALVRSLDPTRPIAGNLFVDTSPLGLLPSQAAALRDRARTILGLADILGLDVYSVRPVATGHVQLSLSWPLWEWEPRLLALQRLGAAAGKQTWISEAQAEPWAPSRLVDTRATPAGKTSPALTSTTVQRLQADGFSTILFWGVEYWYMRSERYQDADWWSRMLPFFARPPAIQRGTPGDA
jgi:hypothetical protein